MFTSIAIWDCVLYRVFRKKCTKFMHHFATVCHRVMRFSAKCSKRNCLHDKSKCLNTTTKYSLFCRWQVNFLKTKLTATSLKQIRDYEQSSRQARFPEEKRCSMCPLREWVSNFLMAHQHKKGPSVPYICLLLRDYNRKINRSTARTNNRRQSFN